MKNAPIMTGKVESCQPRPDEIRSAITRGTGIWIASSQGRENLMALARQYPKGRFNTATRSATIQRVDMPGVS
jgi:hypothetical protein